MGSYRRPSTSGGTYYRTMPNEGYSSNFMRRESRRESFSSTSSSSSSVRRPKWYSDVPILGSLVRTMKDILGLHDIVRYRDSYHYIGDRSHRRRRRRYTPPSSNMRFDDEYYDYYRGRRRETGSSNARPQHYHDKKPPTRTYYSPRLKSKRYYREFRSELEGDSIYRDNEPFLGGPSRSSSTSSYTRSRHPNTITSRSPGRETDSKRRVSFADPLINSSRPRQKRPSIDDQTGSRKRIPTEQRGRYYSQDNTNIRAPRPRSPVIERRPGRPGQRISPRRGSRSSIDQGGASSSYDVEYIPSRESRPYSYTSDIDIIERLPKRPLSSERWERQFSATADRDFHFSRKPPDLVQNGHKELNERSSRCLDKAAIRRPYHYQDRFEVRRS